MKIVIIDDEDVICSGLTRIIAESQEPWELEEVYNDPEEALEFCDWDRIDLLLTDINMPGMDGLTLVDTLRERGYDTQVIFISGFAEFKYAQKAIQQKAVDYIIKPVAIPDLLHAINKAQVVYEQKKQQLKDETFIKDNITLITKGFIYDVLFETKQLHEEDIRRNLSLCGLADKYFSICNLILPAGNKRLEAFLAQYEGSQSVCLYRGSSQVYTFVLCDNADTPARIDGLIGDIRRHCPGAILGEYRSTRDIRQLPEMYYELMVCLRNDHQGRVEPGVKEDSHAGENNGKEYSMHVVKAIEYIRAHYAEKISLAKLSEEIFVHPTYLSNLFKGQTGTTVVEYINHYRIEMAREMLKDSRNKIFWVGEQVGFVNQRYFSHIFKKYNGCTPVQYKQDNFLRGPI